jgi:tRNA (guanine37-N1)-methyltransferase
MKIAVVTLFPALFDGFTRLGIVGRAIETGLLTWCAENPRDYATDNYKSVDDRPYGGGPGMVMMPEPLQAAITAARKRLNGEAKVIYLTPAGRKLDQAGVLALAQEAALILIAGRYEGVDERLLQTEVDEEWSIGDYVLSGGEPAAMVLVDAVVRQLPGALGHEESAQQDSFAAGLLEHEHYTRPEEWQGQRVPAVLLSGDHAQIRRWRLKRALGRTWLRRPDLLEKLQLNAEQQRLLEEFQREYAETGSQK